MLIWMGKTQKLAGLTLATLVFIQPAASAGGFFFGSKSNCGCADTPPGCYSNGDDCHRTSSWKQKFCCCKEAPLAPVVGSIPAVMVNQAAIPAPATQGESEQLKQLRDMLVQTNQAIQNARQSAVQQSAAANDAAAIQELKKELEELKTSMRTLRKAINDLPPQK
jgi:hypothetical protein